jgi:excisionase family DNA binding protein
VKQESVNGAFGAWLTKPQALSLLGKSDRSLDRLVAARKVQRTTRPREGRSPEPLYNRADLERVTAVEAFEVERVDEIERQNKLAVRRPPDEALFAARSVSELTALVNLVKGGVSAPPPPSPPLWCTVEAASAMTGLSARLLKRLIQAGKLPALRDGREWKICRSDLHNIEAPARPPAEELEALARAEVKKHSRATVARKAVGAP